MIIPRGAWIDIYLDNILYNVDATGIDVQMGDVATLIWQIIIPTRTLDERKYASVKCE